MSARAAQRTGNEENLVVCSKHVDFTVTGHFWGWLGTDACKLQILKKDCFATFIMGSSAHLVYVEVVLLNNISRTPRHGFPPSTHGLYSVIILRGMWGRTDPQITPTTLSSSTPKHCGITTTQSPEMGSGRETAASGPTAGTSAP